MKKGEQDVSIVPTDWKRGNAHKLKCMKFHLNTRKHFVALEVVKYWNRLLREAVKSCTVSTSTFKTQLEIVLGNLLFLTMLEQKV